MYSFDCLNASECMHVVVLMFVLVLLPPLLLVLMIAILYGSVFWYEATILVALMLLSPCR